MALLRAPAQPGEESALPRPTGPGCRQIRRVRPATLVDHPVSMSEGTAAMQKSQVRSAVGAAMSSAAALDLRVDDAVVLHNSNRLTVRLLPCDVVARIVPVAYQAGAEFEVEVARRLAETDSPVAALEPRVEPRVYVRDGFVINMWAYYEPVSPSEMAPAEYAHALERLHAGMRQIDFTTPRFTDRVAEAQRLVGSRDHTPALADADRELLSNTLRSLRRVIDDRGAAEQLLHGEPHAGNVLKTKNGPLFIDFETCCQGPVEFDIAHVPEAVSEHYPGADQELLRECRILMLAMVASWRWDRRDQFPNGRRMGTALLSRLRSEQQIKSGEAARAASHCPDGSRASSPFPGAVPDSH